MLATYQMTPAAAQQKKTTAKAVTNARCQRIVLPFDAAPFRSPPAVGGLESSDLRGDVSPVGSAICAVFPNESDRASEVCVGTPEFPATFDQHIVPRRRRNRRMLDEPGGPTNLDSPRLAARFQQTQRDNKGV